MRVLFFLLYCLAFAWPAGATQFPNSAKLLDYNAKCDGLTDDSAAINLAATAAGSSGVIEFPPNATCVVTAAVTVGASIHGNHATLLCQQDLGTGNACLTITNAQVITDLNIFSLGIFSPNTFASGCSLVLGTGINCPATIGMDGLKIGATPGGAPQPYMEFLDVEGFHSGIVYNTSFGHLSLLNSIVRNNYYDLYILQNGGDTKIVNSTIVGAAMAMIACAPGSHCLDGSCYIAATHIGFGPFGIYQEPAYHQALASSSWIQNCTFDEVHLESIGNAAIMSQTTGNGALASWPAVTSLYIKHPGFSFNGSYELTNTTTQSSTTSSVTNPQVLTSVANTANIVVGERITCSGVPNHTFVVSKTASTVTMTQNATASAAVNCTFAFDQSYAIDLTDLKGEIYILQGSFPFTPGSSNAIIYTLNGDVGDVIMRYDDGNVGPPATANNLYIDDNSGNDIFSIGIQWPAQVGAVVGCTVANGSNTCTKTFPWQYVTGRTDGIGVNGYGQTLGNAEAATITWSVSSQNVTYTVTMQANCTNAGGCTYFWGP